MDKYFKWLFVGLGIFKFAQGQKDRFINNIEVNYLPISRDDFNLGTGELTLKLQIANKNLEPVPVDGFKGVARMNGEQLATINTTGNIQIPGKGTKRIDLKLKFLGSKVFLVLSKIVESGAMSPLNITGSMIVKGVHFPINYSKTIV